MTNLLAPTNTLVKHHVDESVSQQRVSDLASRLRLLLDESGMTGRELSRKINASPSYIESILNGRSKSPEATKLRRIAEVTGCDVAWLISGIGQRDPRVVRLEAKDVDPPVGTFLMQIDRLPGLRQWLERNPTKLTVSELARGMQLYDLAPHATVPSGDHPYGDWDGFFADALSGRLTKPLRGNQAAAEEAELSQTPKKFRTAMKRKER